MSAAADRFSHLSYQGLGWKSPAESEAGCGVNFAHQGSIIFVTWFTYDVNRKPLWLIAVAESSRRTSIRARSRPSPARR